MTSYRFNSVIVTKLSIYHMVALIYTKMQYTFVFLVFIKENICVNLLEQPLFYQKIKGFRGDLYLKFQQKCSKLYEFKVILC